MFYGRTGANTPLPVYEGTLWLLRTHAHARVLAAPDAEPWFVYLSSL